MARTRRRHEIRWSVWTFVAPVALVVVAIVVVSVVRGAVDDARTAERDGGTTAAATTGAGATTGEGATTDGAPAKRRTYTVRAGETLSDIAERFGTTVEAILALNKDLDPNAIQPGQRIRVT